MINTSYRSTSSQINQMWKHTSIIDYVNLSGAINHVSKNLLHFHGHELNLNEQPKKGYQIGHLSQSSSEQFKSRKRARDIQGESRMCHITLLLT